MIFEQKIERFCKKANNFTQSFSNHLFDLTYQIKTSKKKFHKKIFVAKKGEQKFYESSFGF